MLSVTYWNNTQFVDDHKLRLPVDDGKLIKVNSASIDVLLPNQTMDGFVVAQAGVLIKDSPDQTGVVQALAYVRSAIKGVIYKASSDETITVYDNPVMIPINKVTLSDCLLVSIQGATGMGGTIRLTIDWDTTSAGEISLVQRLYT